MGIELMAVILIVFMLLAALIAVESRDLLSAVVAVGAAGFALSVLDLLLGAPDLAMTQVVVEVISLVLLIRVVVTRTDSAGPRSADVFRTGLAMLAAGVLLTAVYFAVGGGGATGVMPPFGQPVLTNSPDATVPPGIGHDYLARSAGETGAANAVMGVLLDYRAYDTLGEATVIFVSILGAYALLRRAGRKAKEPQP